MPFLLRIFFFIGDLIFLNSAILLSYSLTYTAFGEANLSNSIYLLGFSNVAWLFLVLVSNPYAFTRNSGIRQVLLNQLSFLFVHLLVVVSLILIFNKTYSYSQIGIMYILFIPVFFIWKPITYFLFSMTTKRAKEYNICLIGQHQIIQGVKSLLLANGDARYNIIHEELWPEITAQRLQVLKTICLTKGIDEVHCAQVEIPPAILKDLINFGLNNLIRIKLMTEQELSNKKNYAINASLITADRLAVPLDDLTNRIYKRTFDLIFSLLIIILIVWWLIPIVAFLIKVNSKGPVFFSQLRAGRNNKPFRCLKFRTMIVNNEADTKQATRNDSRVTLIGGFLRKTSLDEFPQFINVILGQMSVIGPRPHPIKLNEKFSPLIEQLMSRHYIKPGITGLAQAMGYRGETQNITDMRNRIKLDRFYIENWSLFFDIQIIFQTVFSLMRGSEKAY